MNTSINATKELAKYKNDMKMSGEKLVTEIFPSRVFEMEKMLNSIEFSNLKVETINGINGKGDSAVPVNTSLQNMMEVLRPLIIRLTEDVLKVRMWIQFNIPKIEDGNNFGVGILEEVLGETLNIEKDSNSFMEQMSRYHISRGKMVSKYLKYPNIQDYRECVKNADEMQAISLRYIVMEMRNHYAILHDMIQKNIERIKMPRTNNSINMY